MRYDPIGRLSGVTAADDRSRRRYASGWVCIWLDLRLDAAAYAYAIEDWLPESADKQVM